MNVYQVMDQHHVKCVSGYGRVYLSCHLTVQWCMHTLDCAQTPIKHMSLIIDNSSCIIVPRERHMT